MPQAIVRLNKQINSVLIVKQNKQINDKTLNELFFLNVIKRIKLLPHIQYR